MSVVNHVASELMKAWFPRNHVDQNWLNSDDGKNWTEIALLDAEVAVKAYESYYEDDLK